jgi:pimeloyl-ACP methyl ester carboxylesterase
MHFYRTDSEYRDDATTAAAGRCPVYLMTGEYDYSCTPQLTRESAARIPGAEAIIMQGLGHFPMSENPARFRDYLLPVLERIAGNRDPASPT